MDPSSQRSRGWNFVSCEEVLLVSYCNIIVLGDLSFSWGEEGLLAERWCWVRIIGYNPPRFFLISIKLFKFSSIFLHILWYMFVCGQYTSDLILFMLVDLCSWIVLCCFDSIGAFWSWADEEASDKDLSEGRGIKWGTKRKIEVGVLIPLLYICHKGIRK